jgi:hypothetical protein
MRLRILVATFLVIGCSRSSPSAGERQDLLAQAFIYGLDSLAVGENAAVRPCLGIDADTETVDPPDEVLATLRQRNSRVLTRSQCKGMFKDLSSVHDTMLIAVNFDSLSTSQPRIGLRTWRSGLWGSGHLCSLRQTKDGWELLHCQLAWLS